MTAVLYIKGTTIELREENDDTVLCEHTDWIACPHKQKQTVSEKQTLNEDVKDIGIEQECPYWLIRNFIGDIDENLLNQPCQFVIFIKKNSEAIDAKKYTYNIQNLKKNQKLNAKKFTPTFDCDPEPQDGFSQCIYWVLYNSYIERKQ